MHLFHALSVSVRMEPPAALEADLLALPVFDGDDLGDLPGLDAASGGEVSRILQTGELARRPFEIALVALPCGGYAARRALLVGLRKRDDFTADAARTLGALAATVARQRHAPRVLVRLRPHAAVGAERDPLRLVQAAAEGLVLPQLDTASHKTEEPERMPLESVGLACAGIAAQARDVADAAERGRILGEATNRTRALANQPGNVITPTRLAAAALSLAGDTSLQTEVLDEQAIAEANMGLLLGVASGSAEPPRIIVLRHRPDADPAGATPVLGLIGKGVTFDTGGISIKPAEGMERMKADMAGGAAVIAAMCAIAKLRVPLPVIGIVPCTENMPGGRAMKPGDILTSASGRTVEVVNTDAEGRLLLGDALWYARRLGATHLVDVATLTGACAVALGRHASALFAAPDEWGALVRQAGDRAGDRLWPMPLFDEYLEQLKSDTADLTNTGGRFGGAATAALFLKQFAGDGPWAHLDIAGTSWVDEPRPWQSKGASGVATRTLVELARSMARP